MLFSSTTFIYMFLPFTLICYYGILRWSRTAQNVFLFLASLLFYGWGEPKFVFAMLGSIVINWFFGLLIHKYKSENKLPLAKLCIGIDCFFNLGMLFIFKYLNFTADIIFSFFGEHSPIGAIALPIGISFFTFQAMSYVIDVYRDRGEVQKNILNVGLYISFFPQLIAGPIVRYETVAYEIQNRKETWDDFFEGFTRFVIGIGKKVLIANSVAVVADEVFGFVGQGPVSTAAAWLGAIAYSLQIFFDFSGYSDMAIGLGKMFGFHFLENFNYPYISKSITEFWRRWHMSLGTWFRDYVYFPLGGSRVKSSRMVFNLFVVWLLTGFWHGANWTFVVWGLMYFVLLTVEKLTGIVNKEGKLINIIKWAYTMLFVIIGWVFFRAENLSVGLDYLGYMFGINNQDAQSLLYFKAMLSQSLIIILIGLVCSTPIFKIIGKKIKENFITNLIYAVGVALIFIMSVSSLVSSSYNPFIYFNF